MTRYLNTDLVIVGENLHTLDKGRILFLVGVGVTVAYLLAVLIVALLVYRRSKSQDSSPEDSLDAKRNDT